jgi:two-component system NtrC family response regulator
MILADRLEHSELKLGTILVVEDDANMRRVTQIQLEKLGYETAVAVDVPQALEILQQEPRDLVISDLNLPGMSGLELLKRVRVEHPETTIVMVTAFGTVETAVEAMKSGAYDYLTKPVHPIELRTVVNRVFERRRLIEEVRMLRSNIHQKFGFENIMGQSSALLGVLNLASRVARTDAAVLIRGETGTGKELLAKAIHFNSLRRDRPFVIINCAAIPRDLIESELFGHVKGAFTGALTNKKGKVEVADGGTVFLDEIGEMPLDMQVRLLRLIQEYEIEKVGASNPIHVDVRIIAATHRNLEVLVENHAFREDLYYRLSVVPIEVPPLRERSEDIPELVQQFFQQSKEKHHRENLHLPESLIPFFSRYDWPGNVRQLLNCIVRMVVLAPGEELTISDLPAWLRPPPPAQTEAPVLLTEGATLGSVEREMILQALQKFSWNQTRAAHQLGITRKVLIGRIARYGINKGPPPGFEAE